ncbi:poly-beta-1,6-N-acetyl-D-glucosamine N-deacetylase PgaB [Cognatiluteimonas profundi]|uniref:poly-beta-1,6-N-acetyl-D-glucosamine N-deacetylase PgaB n=1 Tax=Cognatiluteimonas profundi TaxID=2594501 RepID=UPI00131E9CDB|nr:poly-beta-1,6-N-acetyl-D-glucosamine N-deacetylase PgaB [Lysobacter profundi]
MFRDSVSRLIVQLLAGCCLLACASIGMCTPPVKLTILSYHEIAERSDALAPLYTVTPANFAAQIHWLRDSGHHFVSVDDVLADARGSRRLPTDAVLITFDDGYQSVYTQAFPILKAMKVPAVIALVGSWLDAKGSVDFDGRSVPRSDLLSWDEIREMTRSGLVEVASHTYDLHRGIVANPQGNLEPAGTARQWLPASRRYEDEASYQRRVSADLRRNQQLLKSHLGRAPRVIVWPYGRYNVETTRIARSLGMPVGLTLDDGPDTAQVPLEALRRVLVEQPMSVADLQRDITLRNTFVIDDGRPAKVMHLDLDYIYDPDPLQQEKNLGRWLDRIIAMGVNTVYLQAFSDPDANGAADAVYFPNRHLPMRADLFNRVAWQISTRTQVKRVYAWMPVLAWQLPDSDPAAQDRVVTLPNVANHLAMGYPRLSPFSPRARQAIREVYEDLARDATIDGILFHDDLTLSDYEDGSPWALKAYRAWGLPASVAAIRGSDALLTRWSRHKTAYLDAFAKELAQVVRDEQPGLLTARNLYAQVVLNPKSEDWYSQSLAGSLANYDYTAIMAMPYMEQAADPAAFLDAIVRKVAAQPNGLKKAVIELQTVDWRRQDAPIPSTELADTIRSLYAHGVLNVAYYPDNLYRNNPDPAVLRPVFDSKPDKPRAPAMAARHAGAAAAAAGR